MRQIQPFVTFCLIASIATGIPLAKFAMVTGTDRAQPDVTMDPSDVVDGQFSEVLLTSNLSSPGDVVDWLSRINEIFVRVGSGGLASLPPQGLIAIETIQTKITSAPHLINSVIVLKSLLCALPPLWKVGFWYRPVSEWRISFGKVFDKAVSAAKLAHDATCYDAAVNATSQILRFTKDQVFWDGRDHGACLELQGQNRDYMNYLPDLVQVLSKQEDFMLTETQLRTFMATKMPSKTEGMVTGVAFPVYVDTSIYRISDAVALAKLTQNK